MSRKSGLLVGALALMSAGLMTIAAFGQSKPGAQYDVGASDTEIKIGHFNPYSGPVSACAGGGLLDGRGVPGSCWTVKFSATAVLLGDVTGEMRFGSR